MIWGILKKCCNPIPQRFIVATMVMTGLAFQYIHRLAFNLAITVITYQLNATDDKHHGETCDFNETTVTIAENSNKAEFHWDSHDQAHLLGGFYIGYLITHLPGGMLADKYGPKNVLGYGVLVSAICSVITPVSARIHVNLLVAIRAIMGLAQGPLFPALSVFNARWSLPEERNLMSAYMSAGVVTGAILANTITGFMLFHIKHWDCVFYIYSGITGIWYILWILFAHNTVTKHPFISEKEQRKLNEALQSEVSEDTKLKFPYKAILKSAPMWAMVIAGCGHDWAFYIIVSLLPQYMSYVLHFNVKDNGLINSLPYVAMVMISLSTAKLAELVVAKGWMSKTIQCKIWLVLANEVPCISYILASYAGCNRGVVIAMFCIAMGIQGMVYSSIRVVNVDMAPNFAGTLMSIMNGLGSLCGFFGPKLFATFTSHHTAETWRIAFFISSGIITFTTLVFVIWGSSKLQPWNFPIQSQPTNNERAAEENT